MSEAAKKRCREEWATLVDLVAADRSTDAAMSFLPKNDVTMSAFLPRPLSAELRTHLTEDAEAFDVAYGQWCRPQININEGYHAKPIPLCSSDLFSKNVGTGNVSAAPSDSNAITDSGVAVKRRQSNGTSSKTKEVTQLAGTDDTNRAMQRRAVELGPVIEQILRRADGAAGGRNADDVTRDSLWFGVTERLTSGFRRQRLLDYRYAKADFLPIILIPSGPSAALQLFNARAFLEDGDYIHPSKSYTNPIGATNREDAKPENVVVSPSQFFSAETLRSCAFRKFRIVDDPRKIENWDHVCACIVTGVEWQLEEWFGKDSGVAPEATRFHAASALFDFLRGFLAYFEEDKLPGALTSWKVHPLVLTRKYVKAASHIMQAYTFWEELYRFISVNPRFAHFVASGVDE